jgi:hypothetical protein
MPPERRAAFLREACGSDHELREQTEAMLKGESGAADFLNKPLLEELAGDMANSAIWRAAAFGTMK